MHSRWPLEERNKIKSKLCSQSSYHFAQIVLASCHAMAASSHTWFRLYLVGLVWIERRKQINKK
jgi:hypothetical protein